ncbi:unnamed protein product [Tuber melanosporum]|uniref:(Perigord truffle) hypothetical protein n=1 Tax=Tuber melanosporum (strain Mel28) TaxID=656061 RepID=D5GG95_TUBMM|nr:uncharacterized protein GSTUM_00007276001 [Tuber melanosporum]CAZ83538.1 unnamed protein product [Tuber melanosporum]
MVMGPFFFSRSLGLAFNDMFHGWLLFRSSPLGIFFFFSVIEDWR